MSKRQAKKLKAATQNALGIDMRQFKDNPFAAADDFQDILDSTNDTPSQKERAWAEGSTRSKRRRGDGAQSKRGGGKGAAASKRGKKPRR